MVTVAGGVPMWMVFAEDVAVWPCPLLTVTVAVYVPVPAYVWLIVRPVLVLPSPRSHVYVVTPSRAVSDCGVASRLIGDPIGMCASLASVMFATAGAASSSVIVSLSVPQWFVTVAIIVNVCTPEIPVYVWVVVAPVAVVPSPNDQDTVPPPVIADASVMAWPVVYFDPVGGVVMVIVGISPTWMVIVSVVVPPCSFPTSRDIVWSPVANAWVISRADPIGVLPSLHTHVAMSASSVGCCAPSDTCSPVGRYAPSAGSVMIAGIESAISIWCVACAVPHMLVAVTVIVYVFIAGLLPLTYVWLLVAVLPGVVPSPHSIIHADTGCVLVAATVIPMPYVPTPGADICGVSGASPT